MQHRLQRTFARKAAQEAQARAAAARCWAAIALERLNSRKPLNDAARDVLQGMAAGIACEAEAALEASNQLTQAIGR